MIAAKRWETSSHHRWAMGSGGRGRSRYHLVREDFRRRMMAYLALERNVVPATVVRKEESREVMFTYTRKKRSKVGSRMVELKAGEARNEEGEKGGDAGGKEGVGLCPEVDGDGNKVCVHCRATKTPLWRSGPAGPKTLCNACGIRYRKMRRKGIIGSSHEDGNGVDGNSAASFFNGYVQTPEDEVLRQRQKRKQEGLWLLLQQSRKFASRCGKEEAEAAVLLMALSTGLFVHSS